MLDDHRLLQRDRMMLADLAVALRDNDAERIRWHAELLLERVDRMHDPAAIMVEQDAAIIAAIDFGSTDK